MTARPRRSKKHKKPRDRRRGVAMRDRLEPLTAPQSPVKRTESTLGIGIIGVSPVRGWAAAAHILALPRAPAGNVRGVARVLRRATGISGASFFGLRCQVRIEGGVMDGQIESTQRAQEQLPSSEEAWRQRLSPEQFEVLRNKGTERAFTGKYAFTKDRGTYRCAACGAELFRSEAKYDSGTGWPSFFEPITRGAVDLHEDVSFGMRRIEVTCARCGGHLGHLFDDGPEPTGERYCMNSISLNLEGDDAQRGGVVD
jgi:peptide-methionine (R)-S-oxide reductase